MKRLDVYNGERIYVDGLTHLQTSLSNAIKERQSDIWSNGVLNGLQVKTSPNDSNSLYVTSGEAYDRGGERIYIPNDVDNVKYNNFYVNASSGTYNVVSRHQDGNLSYYEIDLNGLTHYTHITDSYSVNVLKEGTDTILENDVRLSDVIVTIDGGTYIYDTENRDILTCNVIQGITSSNIIQDLDGDTKVEVEKNLDEDKIRFTTYGNERVVIDSNGNVGIGTKNPTAKFEVESPENGVVVLGRFESYPTSGNYGALVLSGSGQESVIGNVYNSIAANQYTFHQVGGDSLGAGVNIRKGGNVGIGVVDPDQKLEVAGTIHAQNLEGGAINLTADASGNIIRDPSDKKFKKDIKPLENSLDIIKKLNGVSYKYNNDEIKMGEDIEYGFIAQDVLKEIPELVIGKEYYSVKYIKIIPLLVESIKEMSKKIELLEKEINILKSKV